MRWRGLLRFMGITTHFLLALIFICFVVFAAMVIIWDNFMTHGYV